MVKSVYFVVIFVINGIYADPECSTLTYADLTKCCALPPLVVYDKCQQHLKDEGSVEDRSCYLECVANEINAKEPNLETFKAFIDKTMENGSDFLNLFTYSLDFCIRFATEKAKVEDAASQGQCSHYPRIVLECTTASSFFYCPDNKWTKGADCNALREKVKNCYKIH